MTKLEQAQLLTKFLDIIDKEYDAEGDIVPQLMDIALDYHAIYGLENMQSLDINLFKRLKKRAIIMSSALLKQVAVEHPEYIPVVKLISQERVALEYFASAFVYEYYFMHIAIARIFNAIKSGQFPS